MDYIKKVSWINKFFILLIVLYIPLVIYVIPGTSLPIPDAILLLFLPYLIFKKSIVSHTNNRMKKIILIFITMIVLNLIFVSIMYPGTVSQIIGRTMRYLLYWTVLYFFDKWFNKDVFLKFFRFVGCFTVFFLVLQNVGVFLFDIFIPGGILSEKIMLPGEYVGMCSQVKNILEMNGRPFAFFSEPSVCAYFLSVLLCVELFYYEASKWKETFLITIGIVIAMSNTGLILLAFLWVVYILRYVIMTHKIKASVLTIGMLSGFGLIVFIAGLSLSGRLNSLIERFSSKGVRSGRLLGWNVFNDKFSSMQILFGHGMNDNYSIFLADIPRTYYYFGIVGVVIVLLFILFVYAKSKQFSRMLILVMLLSGIGASASYGQFILLTVSLLNLRTFKDEQNMPYYT